jgi:hypothetical protein
MRQRDAGVGGGDLVEVALPNDRADHAAQPADALDLRVRQLALVPLVP